MKFTVIKRTITIANPSRLSLKLYQLKIENKESGEVHTVPLEDIGYLFLEHQQISLTVPLLQVCAEENIAVIICDERHHPAAQFTSFASHNLTGKRIRAQITATKPIQKRVWQELIRQKILNQATVVGAPFDQTLKGLAKEVKSGDSTNREGVAAKVYWQGLFGSDFIRDPNSDSPNDILNYGYTILRAATVRSIVGSGLSPTFGVFHTNQYNPFPLADDVMEPYRPFVDQIVQRIVERDEAIDFQNSKNILKRVLVEDVRIDGLMRPLQLALSMTTSSLAEIYDGKKEKLSLPELIK